MQIMLNFNNRPDAVSCNKTNYRIALGILGLAATFFLIWLLWPVNFKIYLENNPSKTKLMEIRQQQAKRSGVPYRIRYRWVPLRRIAEPLKKAVIAAEDDIFYRHHGLDFTAIRISVKKNLRTRSYSQGGSTITQQVVKNLHLSPKKSMLRKLREAVLAFQIERVLSKNRILEMYLNIAEWGKGIFGAEAAALHYFGKSAADLTLDEAIALVAVLPSPLKHSPVREDRFLTWRKTWVRRQLRYTGYLPSETQPEPQESEPVPDWISNEENEPAEFNPGYDRADPNGNTEPVAEIILLDSEPEYDESSGTNSTLGPSSLPTADELFNELGTEP